MGDTARGRGCAQEAGARGVQEAVERHTVPWIWPLVIQMSHFGDRCFCDYFDFDAQVTLTNAYSCPNLVMHKVEELISQPFVGQI